MTKTTGVEAQVSIIRCPKCGGEMRLVPTLEEGRLMKMKISEIHKPKWYFRQDMGEDLEALGQSVLQGQEEPVEIFMEDGKWRTIDGWRRITAAKKVGIEEIEAREYQGDDPLLSALVRATFDKSHDVFEKGEGFTRWLDGKLSGISGDAPRPADAFAFIHSTRTRGTWQELNEALGDPLGILAAKTGSLITVEGYMGSFRSASEGVRDAVRSGDLAPSTGHEIARGLPRWKNLQDKVANKALGEQLPKRHVVRGCKVLRKVIREYEGDAEAVDAVLEDDWTRSEAQMLAFVGIYKEVKKHTGDWYDEAPEVRVLLTNFRSIKRDLVELFDGMGDAALRGKFSPEAIRFVVNWLRDVANKAVDIADELEEEDA